MFTSPAATTVSGTSPCLGAGGTVRRSEYPDGYGQPWSAALGADRKAPRGANAASASMMPATEAHGAQEYLAQLREAAAALTHFMLNACGKRNIYGQRREKLSGEQALQLHPRQIEAFRAVMLTGSMTRAGELLKITQPAVSRLIRDLEVELEFRLFRRDGNRLIPSHEGTVLFSEVDKFHIGFERITKLAGDLRSMKAGSLRIAAIGVLSSTCITEAISAFHPERPAVNVLLESLNSRSVLELVAGRHFDIGFAQVSGEYPGVNLTPLPPLELVCILPLNHQLARKPYLELEDFRELPFISLGKNVPMRLKIDQMFDARQIPRHMSLEMSLGSSVVELVASGSGVSIVDSFTVTAFGHKRVAVRPLNSNLTFDVFVVEPSHQQASKLCREFTVIVKRLFRSMRSRVAELSEL